MRDVILYMSMSLDGFVGSDREHPGVAVPEGTELRQWKLDHVRKAGAHLMGRTTYQEMSSYWPHSDDDYAAPMNDIPKVVFSTTLTDAEAAWPVTRVARGDLATEIAMIKAEPGPDVIVWEGRGSPALSLRRTWSTSTASWSSHWSWALGRACSISCRTPGTWTWSMA